MRPLWWLLFELDHLFPSHLINSASSYPSTLIHFYAANYCPIGVLFS
jgi:hypothetical protein